MPILVATDREVVVIDVERSSSASAPGIGDRPRCLAADPLVHGRAWCGTHRAGMFRSDDGGRSWQPVGLAGRLIMVVTASPVERGRRLGGHRAERGVAIRERGRYMGAHQQAADGYFESDDAGATWRSPSAGSWSRH